MLMRQPSFVIRQCVKAHGYDWADWPFEDRKVVKQKIDSCGGINGHVIRALWNQDGWESLARQFENTGFLMAGG